MSDLERANPNRSRLDFAKEVGKSKRDQGKKAGKLRPLAKQKVSLTDSVLASMSRWPNPGLSINAYDQLIKAAFQEKWWRSNKVIRVNADGSKL